MNELINAVKDWPVILQGALGSALFALIVILGQSVTSKVLALYSHHSKIARRSWLVSAKIKYEGATSNDRIESTNCVSLLIYRSLRYLFKALMWLTLGLIFQEILAHSGLIGFLGCLYYLFRAYEVVSPITQEDDHSKKLEELTKELIDFDNQNQNKSIPKK